MSIEIDLEAPASGPCVDFVARRQGRSVPASLWNGGPPRADAPLIMIQHGGPFHKRHERSDWLAEQVVERTDAAVLLIDGPVHGRRRADSPSLEQMLGEFERHWRANPGIEGMVADWQLALDAVVGEGWADPRKVAWLGPSMGTAYGIPVCAAEPRIKAAAFGMWGLEWGQEAALLGQAARVQAPVLFQIKAADEIFGVAGQRRLFDALGSSNKCLRTYPGGHSLTGPGQLDELIDFVAGSLGQAASAAPRAPLINEMGSPS